VTTIQNDCHRTYKSQPRPSSCIGSDAPPATTSVVTSVLAVVPGSAIVSESSLVACESVDVAVPDVLDAPMLPLVCVTLSTVPLAGVGIGVGSGVGAGVGCG